jgi:hypothetical protein
LQGQRSDKEETMAYPEDPGHPLTRGAGCGHVAIGYQGHSHYLHTGHLRRIHAAHADEHSIGGGGDPPSRTPQHACGRCWGLARLLAPVST